MYQEIRSFCMNSVRLVSSLIFLHVASSFKRPRNPPGKRQIHIRALLPGLYFAKSPPGRKALTFGQGRYNESGIILRVLDNVLNLATFADAQKRFEISSIPLYVRRTPCDRFL